MKVIRYVHTICGFNTFQMKVRKASEYNSKVQKFHMADT